MTPRQALFSLTATCTALLLSGCGVAPAKQADAVSVKPTSAALQGIVHGGQQPVSGARIHLYVAGTTGYNAANTDILTSVVTSNSSGGFSLTGLYNCTAGQKLYLVAMGGNPGAGTNSQLGLMTALGDCSGLSSSTTIQVNEITTVAAAFALAPFMSGYSTLGSSATNTAGLAAAFNSANKLANTATGLAGGPSLATGATAPLSTINTLANIIASCVNTTGGSAGDNSVCGKLFTYATPSGGTSPGNTIDLALALAKNPALNVASIYPYSNPSAPFQPTLSSQPTDFTLAITYPGFSSPQSLAVDAGGQVWVSNQGNNSVTVLNQSGTVVNTLTSNGLNAPAGIAIDPNGNAWIANSGSTTLSVFTNAGSAWTTSPMDTTHNQPVSLAFDANYGLWVANQSSNYVTLMEANGTTVQSAWTPKSSYSSVTAPGVVVINPR